MAVKSAAQSGYLSADHSDYWIGLMLVGSVRTGGLSRFGVLPSEPIINFFVYVVRSETVALMKGLLEALSPSSDSFQIVLSKFAPLLVLLV